MESVIMAIKVVAVYKGTSQGFKNYMAWLVKKQNKAAVVDFRPYLFAAEREGAINGG